MAKLIQAYATYGPRLDLLTAIDPDGFMESITERTSLSSGVVKNVRESEVHSLITPALAGGARGMLKQGRPVHTGVAIFTPFIDAKGNLSVKVKVDKRITGMLNVAGAFKGKINKGDNIGKSTGELVQMWNEEHPEDLIVSGSEPESQPG